MLQYSLAKSVAPSVVGILAGAVRSSVPSVVPFTEAVARTLTPEIPAWVALTYANNSADFPGTKRRSDFRTL